MFRFHGAIKHTFAVGHMALAYILGKASAKPLKINISIPILLVLSLLPDVDIIFLGELHRGPTHSMIAAFAIFIPVFVFYSYRAIPYFLALVSHSLIADFLIGGQLQLLWPITTQQFGIDEFGFNHISIYDPLNIALELALFATATLIMCKTRDIFKFLRNNKINLILIVPIFTVLLPTFLAYPLQVPVLFILPHLFYLTLFAIAVLVAILPIPRKDHAREHKKMSWVQLEIPIMNARRCLMNYQ
jgi:membrane-bound metal-dependent hydrolase YbcI (DUF457 family)